jgi:hypothetical protein
METKKCTQCGEEKEICDFFFKNKKTNKLHSQCKSCYKEKRKNKEHYAKYKEEYLERINIRKKIKTSENRVNLLEYFKTHHCVVCAESNPIVLDFDHKDEKEKKYGISSMIYSYNWTTILAEIEKCDVLCANCHRIRTSKQFGWWYENIK